jgi:uncharacterized protein YcfJ
LPKELMAARPAATPTPVSNEPGKLQNSAVATSAPLVASDSSTAVTRVLSVQTALSARHAPPRIAAAVACQRFSLSRSARRVTSTEITALLK